MLLFSEYISKWLYDADGYYSRIGQIGKSGDFITSVSVSKFFGGAIANKFVTLVLNGKLPKNSVICEFGANSLYAVKDFASFVAGLYPELLTTIEFLIVEKNPEVAKKQRVDLEDFFDGKVCFNVVEEITGYEDRVAFVYANEIFDAFSCELLYNGRFAVVNGGKIEFCEQIPTLLQKASSYGIQKGEVALGYEEFATTLYNAFTKSYFVTFDYGQDFARNDFSVRVYREHQTYPLFELTDLAGYFKNSDITYDVNFAHLKNSFTESGFSFVDYKNQMSALVDFGITELLERYMEKAGADAYRAEAAKVSRLLSPSGFGERFKMISFSKGV